jgi:hypothetical protein
MIRHPPDRVMLASGSESHMVEATDPVARSDDPII